MRGDTGIFRHHGGFTFSQTRFGSWSCTTDPKRSVGTKSKGMYLACNPIDGYLHFTSLNAAIAYAGSAYSRKTTTI